MAFSFSVTVGIGDKKKKYLVVIEYLKIFHVVPHARSLVRERERHFFIWCTRKLADCSQSQSIRARFTCSAPMSRPIGSPPKAEFV